MELDDLEIPTMANETELNLAPTDEEANFLASLESEAPTLDAELGSAAANDELALQGATGTALMLLNMVEGVTKNMVHKDFGWQETEKQAAAEQIAPALAKNGGQLPEWLEPYKEEAIALLAIGSLAFGGYMQVKELRKLEEAQNKSPESSRSSTTGTEENIVAA
ncbi:hypothetical protein L1D14_09255 [Vibrio tubiashii]|uniref:hypothetical protein n=1 Tax=Vibrio tubiashii TaxID=29498 RepID=UPI001EFC3863|nr:hypothetical protein [Vibrio tubiashii]MCG9576425.1 hypothetical protein [Vibrio tubiashii]